MENNYDWASSKNFEYVRNTHDKDIDRINDSEARIFDYFNIASSILLAITFSDLKSDNKDSVKLLIILFIVTLSLVIIIGFIGRWKIYKFWQEILKYDFQDAENWRDAQTKVYKTNDVLEKEKVFENAKGRESTISKLKPKGDIDYLIYLQAFLTVLGLVFLLLISIIKLG